MIEQETVLALIEAKEVLDRAHDALHQIQLNDDGETRALPRHAQQQVDHALGLIESILAKGR